MNLKPLTDALAKQLEIELLEQMERASRPDGNEGENDERDEIVMSDGGVWVPGGGDNPHENYENALERTCSIMVHFGGLDAMHVVADAQSYLTETLEQVREHPDVTAEDAADWLEAEDRMEYPLPEPDCEFFAALDDASIRAFRTDGLSANEVVGIYADWVERTKREFETAHGLPEGWADVEVDDEQWR